VSSLTNIYLYISRFLYENCRNIIFFKCRLTRG
jgi:hypothetical protein